MFDFIKNYSYNVDERPFFRSVLGVGVHNGETWNRENWYDRSDTGICHLVTGC